MPKQNARDAFGRFKKGSSQSHAPDDADAAARGFSSPQPESWSGFDTADEEERSSRRPPSKRPSSVQSLDSDTETEGVAAPKLNTARRGRGRTAKACPSRGEFLKPAPVLTERASDAGSESDVIARVDDVQSLNAQQLRAQAGEKLACILEVARKSGNLKGEFVGRLKRSTAVLSEVVDALASRTEAEETRRLRAESNRLRLEVEAYKAELKALRRGFTEARAEAAAAHTAAVAAAEPQAAPANLLGAADLVEELKRSLTTTFGQMLNARLAVIEDRLLPAQTVRPPLRADTLGKATVVPPKAPAEPARKPAPKTGKASKTPAPKPAATASVEPVAGPSRVVEPAPTTAPPAEAWTTVVKRGKGKGKGKSSRPQAAPAAVSSAAKPKPKTVAAAKPKLPAPPKSAAVVLSLQPEAANKGFTYSAIIRMAQEKVDLKELGIDRIRFRQTATGGRMLEIPGSKKEEKADQLAEKLRGVLSEVASITRPVKSTDLSITGLDDAATKERVAAAVAEAGDCDVALVKAGEIRHGATGTGSVLVACPVSAANKLLKKGRLLIGWSSVRVVALGARPMRCYRCMGLGHTRPMCDASADRGDLCFRCGCPGHKAATCQKVEPRCAICADSGRPSGHVMGGRSCVPPKTKGGAARIQATPAAASQAAPEAESQVASEEVVMSE